MLKTDENSPSYISKQHILYSKSKFSYDGLAFLFLQASRSHLVPIRAVTS